MIINDLLKTAALPMYTNITHLSEWHSKLQVQLAVYEWLNILQRTQFGHHLNTRRYKSTFLLYYCNICKAHSQVKTAVIQHRILNIKILAKYFLWLRMVKTQQQLNAVNMSKWHIELDSLSSHIDMHAQAGSALSFWPFTPGSVYMHTKGPALDYI